MKEYINYFDEIKDLSKARQLALLEQARYQAFVVMKLSGKSAMIFVFSLILLVAFVLVTALVFELPSYQSALLIPIPLFISQIFIKRQRGKLINLRSV